VQIIGVSAEVTSKEQTFWLHIITADGQRERIPVLQEQFEVLSGLLQVQAPQQPVQPQYRQYQDEVFAQPPVPQTQVPLPILPEQPQIPEQPQALPSGFEEVAAVLRNQQTAVLTQAQDDDAAPVDYGEVPLRGGLGNVPQI